MRITINKVIAPFILFIFFMENCFYLLNISEINISGSFAYSDIWLIVYLVFWCYILYKLRKKKCVYKFKKTILFFCILIFIAALQEYYLTGQSLSLGIRGQRTILIIFLSYFAIRKFIFIKNLDANKLLNAFMLIGVFSALIYIFQKITYDYVQFIYVMINERSGSARFYIDSSLIHISGLFAAYKYLTSFKLKYLSIYIIDLIYVFWVSQGRLELMSFLFATIVGALITKDFNLKKLFIIIFIIVCLGVFFSSGYIEQILDVMKNVDDTSIEENTMAIRYLGRMLYIMQLTESWNTLIFGCGYPNLLYEPAVIKAGLDMNINLNDNGLWGFVYIYGLIGLIFVIILFVKFIRFAFNLFRKKENLFYLMYICFIVILSYNIIFWYWRYDGAFLLIVVLCLLEHELFDFN